MDPTARTARTFGTGKTSSFVAVATEIISNPTTHNQILYIVETNRAVDKVATRFEDIFSVNKITKNMVRLHSLPAEKSAVCSLDDTQPKEMSRYIEETDLLLIELAMVSYLDQLSSNYCVARADGDPRRAATIHDQGVIVCTLATAAKVNLARNFSPVVVFLDEVARVGELKSLIQLGMFHPKDYIFAGDHIQ